MFFSCHKTGRHSGYLGYIQELKVAGSYRLSSATTPSWSTIYELPQESLNKFCGQDIGAIKAFWLHCSGHASEQFATPLDFLS